MDERNEKLNSPLPMGDWSRMRAELRWAYEGVIQAKYLNLPRDIKPGIPVYYIEEGSLSIEFESGRLEVGAGNWVIITQKLLRRDFSPGAKITSVRFDLTRPDGRSIFDAGLPVIISNDEFPDLRQSVRPLLDSIRLATPTATTNLHRIWSSLSGYLLIRENFFAWLRCLLGVCEKLDEGLGRVDHIDERVRQALRFLDGEALSLSLREAEIAHVAGLSVSQLNRLFSRELGETPKQYWDRRKLNAAISLLASTSTPIKQIAHDLGFASQNYFARWFRGQTQLPPREYREKYSQNWQRYG